MNSMSRDGEMEEEMLTKTEVDAALEWAKLCGRLDPVMKERDEARRQLDELRGWVREAITNLEFGFPETALATLRQSESYEE